MTTTTVAPAPGRVVRRAWQWRWRILAVVVVVGLTAFALSLSALRSQSKVPIVVTPGPKPIVAQAGVVPARQQKLGFRVSGQVKEIAVKVGDQVKAGDVLAALDLSDLQLKLEEAKANLTLQKALIAQSAEPPSASDLQAAKSALASALAKQKEVEGGASPGDVKAAQEAVAAAQASLANAQAQLRKVTAGPTTSDLAGAEANVQSAEAQLATAKQKLSEVTARPRPEDVTAAALGVEQAKNALWSQQLTRDATCGSFGPRSPQCQSANASVAAQETAVQTAQTSLDRAKQPATPDEVTAAQEGVRSAEAAVASAREQLARLKAGPTAADRDAAQAQVDQAAANLRSARAKLEQLQGGATAAEREAAQNAVDQARAALAKLTADPSPATVEVSQAKLHQAEVGVAEAEQALKEAVLVAPFDGTVTSIVARVGDVVAPGTAALTIADLSSLHFETKDLDEVNAAKVHVGQTVQVTVPALDKKTFSGTVTEVDREPTLTASGDVNYVVKIQLQDPPPELRWGQTARVEFK